ncbi:MAG: hypothetical protein OK422_06245 [Thaumarchaeota archaeon]|nr:hypothetical protein [Nitrososphaerota archaeon]
MQQNSVNGLNVLEPIDQFDRDLLSLLGSRVHTSLEDAVSESVGQEVVRVKKLMEAGYLRLVVLSYPWGADFDLELSPAGKELVQEERAIR